jgi:hypothetical protein
MNFSNLLNLAEGTINVWHGDMSIIHGQSRTGDNQFSGSPSSGLGDFFATNNPDYAKDYGNPEQYQINLNKPYNMSIEEFLKFDRGYGASFKKSVSRREELKQQGYDGVIVKHRDNFTIEYILFNKNQAKKIQNKGMVQLQISNIINQYLNSKPGTGGWAEMNNKINQLIDQNPQLKNKIIDYWKSDPRISRQFS